MTQTYNMILLEKNEENEHKFGTSVKYRGHEQILESDDIGKLPPLENMDNEYFYKFNGVWRPEILVEKRWN